MKTPTPNAGERMFPIQSERGAKPHPLLIPWSIAELAYSVYSANYGRSQSLERLSQRGGFGPSEMDMFVPDWRERCSRIAALTAELALRDIEINRLKAAWFNRFESECHRDREIYRKALQRIVDGEYGPGDYADTIADAALSGAKGVEK